MMALESLRQGNAIHDTINGGPPPALPPRSSQHLEPPPLPRGPVHHGTENNHPAVSRKYSPASQNGDASVPPPLPPPPLTPIEQWNPNLTGKVESIYRTYLISIGQLKNSDFHSTVSGKSSVSSFCIVTSSKLNIQSQLMDVAKQFHQFAFMQK